jgi:TRAP-type mannitol/chloroaromatic compound transport system substrate-binding protein
VPFGLAPRQQQAWLHEGGGRELIAELYADFGVLAFPGGNTGVQMGGWFRERVESAADLKGLRMRIPGFGGDVMQALGVSVQNMPGGEIYTSLETARIDATEWVGPYDDEKLGFYKAVKNYYFPGWWEPGPELTFMVDRASFEALPTAFRSMFEVAVREAAANMQQVYDAQNPAALKRLVDAGVQVRPFSQDLMREARTATEDMLSSKAATDPAYARILEPWRAFRTRSNAWFRGAELAYANFAYPFD